MKKNYNCSYFPPHTSLVGCVEILSGTREFSKWITWPNKVQSQLYIAEVPVLTGIIHIFWQTFINLLHYKMSVYVCLCIRNGHMVDHMWMFMCVHVWCICVFICARVLVCRSMCMYMFMHVYVWMCMGVHVCTHVCLLMCKCVCVCVPVHVFMCL